MILSVSISGLIMGECVVVVGSHRSGTSCTAGVIKRLGVVFPSDDLPVNEGNPKGYTESASLNLVLNDMNKFHGNQVFYEPGESDLVAVDEWIGVHAPGDGGLWGVKDPRLVQSLPVFCERLVGAGFTPVVVGVWRPTGEIAQSLTRLGHGEGAAIRMAQSLVGMRDEVFGWVMRAGLRFLPVSYPALVDEPRLGVGKIADFLGLVSTDEAVGFVDPELRRNVV